jgi:hypothetical protein
MSYKKVKKKVKRKKNDYINRLLATWMVYSETRNSSRMRFVSDVVQQVLSCAWSSEWRKNVRALMNVYDGQYDSATFKWIDLLKNSPRHSRGLTNFGYFLFHLGTTQHCEDALGQLSFQDMVEQGTPQSIKFYLSLMLATDHDRADRAIESYYLNSIVEPNRSPTRGDRTIFYWHIPKCAGTSLKQVLGDYFYDAPIGQVLPSYSTVPLLIHCVRHRLERFPFFSSCHQSIYTLGAPVEALEFVVLRDPLDRVLSMFRQTIKGLWTGYPLKILPKYGHAWNYWRAVDAESMLKLMPEELLLRQLSTFSDTLDEEEAARRINSLDAYLLLNGRRDFDDLFNEMGVSVRAADMERLNSSPKDVHITSDSKRRIRKKLQPEHRLLRHIKCINDNKS